jgi:hypothetical protein
LRGVQPRAPFISGPDRRLNRRAERVVFALQAVNLRPQTALSRWRVLLVNCATRSWTADREINGLESSVVALNPSRIRYSWPT